MKEKKFANKYEPKLVEEKWYSFWEKKGYFRADNASKKPPYVIPMPPPNVTGELTMGHVLNNTFQDIIIRMKRMQQYEVLWIPGTDHAGIATQFVVERGLLKKEGKTRDDIGREEFLKIAWRWKEKHEKNIIRQIKRLGASCDWSRYKFTLDPPLSDAVQEAFIRLYKDGLIYRGMYIINWCPRCTTALSDDEVEREEIQGNLYYIKYPLKDGEFIEVATTRPETMLGDTAVAYNPSDKTKKKFKEKIIILPLTEREIPIIEDSAVDPEFGTGFVKVTPSHDPVDFEIAQRHNLKKITVIDKYGYMNENAGKYKGMDRYEARKKILEDLQKLDLLYKIEEHKHTIGKCYRCETILEPYLSEQWFLKMKPLAEKAIKIAQNKEITFYPPVWEKTYYHWLNNVKDWCISRQIWWGHRIPVYICSKCNSNFVQKSNPRICPKCKGKKFVQEEDVLDTWFSSWLWPFSTLGWSNTTQDLKKFYPNETLITGWDILFFWVARMIMAGIEFTGKPPFKNIVLNGMVRDEKRRKLSKSLGNSPDPIKVFDKYGTDAVRFSMCLITPEGQDVLFSEKKMEIGRNFANKLWNAARLLSSHYEDKTIFEKNNLQLEDKWILTLLDELIEDTTRGLENFRFTDTSWKLYTFFWSSYCDWYLEVIKHRLKDKDEKPFALGTAFYVLHNYLKLLHPFMPFITEEIYQNLPGDKDESIVISLWPNKAGFKYEEDVKNFEFLKKLISEIRTIRGEYKIPVHQRTSVYMCWRGLENRKKIVIEKVEIIHRLSKTDSVDFVEKSVKGAAVGYVDGVEIYIPLEGIIDIKKEKNRIKKEIEELNNHIEKLIRRLGNEEFLQKAPKEVVLECEKKLRELKEKKERLKNYIKNL